MKIKRLAYLSFALTAAVTIVVTTLALTDVKSEWKASTGKGRRPLHSVSRPQSVPSVGNADLVAQGMLSSQLHGPLQVLGNRLQRPGLERLTMMGLLVHAGDAQASPFALIWELPGRVRLTEQRGGDTHVLVFDGQNIKSSDSQIDLRDHRTLELLVFDAVEHFFIAQANGAAATRFLGDRFRAEGNIDNTPYDLVEVTEQIGFAGDARAQTRIYYINSDTRLVERLDYQDQRSGSESFVDVRFSDWRALGREQVAHRIEQFENNKPMLTLVIASVSVGPRRDDGAFELSR
jgi:hypothetical protein